MKVLHLASWYPTSKDEFDGDFIERHCMALATQMQADVIHVVQKFHQIKDETTRIEFRNHRQLNASIYFTPLPNSKFNWVQKYLFGRQYNRTINQAVENYIQKNGKPDLIHVHVPVKAGYAALLAKRKWNIPFVVTEHSSAYYDYIDENYFSRNRYFRFITEQSFKQAAAVSSVSNWLLKRMEELFRPAQTFLIRNTVDTNIFYPVYINNPVKKFIHVSMMMPLKNVSGILDALSLLVKETDEWEMIFVGPANEELIQKAASLQLSKHIKWAGALSYAEVARQMQECDALIHFSKYENLPCVVNEALCCGLPVLSSNVGGISELINETNGLLVESENSIQLKDAMLYFLKNASGYNKQLISSTASNDFSYEAIGKKMMELYKIVLKRN